MVQKNVVFLWDTSPSLLSFVGLDSNAISDTTSVDIASPSATPYADHDAYSTRAADWLPLDRQNNRPTRSRNGL